MHRHDLAQSTAVDLRLGALDQRVVAAMMAGEQRHARPLGGFDQGLCRDDVIR